MRIIRRSTLTGLACAFGLLALSATPALAAAPETPTLELTSTTATEATLRGVLSPGAVGEPGTYEFLYRKSKTECKGESQSSQKPALEEEGQEVPETLTGLESGAQYTVCLRVESAATHREAVSAPVTFTLPPPTPEVSVESIKGTEATLQEVQHGMQRRKQGSGLTGDRAWWRTRRSLGNGDRSRSRHRIHGLPVGAQRHRR
jgi:hypothetical protein